MGQLVIGPRILQLEEHNSTIQTPEYPQSQLVVGTFESEKVHLPKNSAFSSGSVCATLAILYKYVARDHFKRK